MTRVGPSGHGLRWRYPVLSPRDPPTHGDILEQLGRGSGAFEVTATEDTWKPRALCRRHLLYDRRTTDERRPGPRLLPTRQRFGETPAISEPWRTLSYGHAKVVL